MPPMNLSPMNLLDTAAGWIVPPFDILTPFGSALVLSGAALSAGWAADSADKRFGVRDASGEVYSVLGVPVGDVRFLAWAGALAYGRYLPQMPGQRWAALGGAAALTSLVVTEGIRLKESGALARWWEGAKELPVIGGLLGGAEQAVTAASEKVQEGAAALTGGAPAAPAPSAAIPEMQALGA